MLPTKLRLALIAAAALVGIGFSAPAHAMPASVETLQKHLYAGETAEAIAALQEQIEQEPGNANARYALGAAQFVAAIEGLAQEMYRYGLRTSPESAEIFDLPLFRIPVASNPNPERLTYEAVRAVLQRFANDLATAAATLATVETGGLALPVNIGLVRIDMNGDGVIAEEEALWRIYHRIAPGRAITAENAKTFLISFDDADVPWLRGYCHLLMGMVEFFLAHDWHVAFEHTFHSLFPDADLPYAAVDDDVRKTRAVLKDMQEQGEESMGPWIPGAERLWMAEVADVITFVHLMHWPVTEPERMARTLSHLESMVGLSRENWRLVLAETDNEAEWVPNPSQTGVLPGITVTPESVQGWKLFLDEFEAILRGDRLIPHWRFDKGINLRRVFLEPTTFDAILWAQGSAALPYLEEGEETTGVVWEQIFSLFQGDFFSYAVWFN